MLPESFVNRMKEMLGEEYEAFSEALKEERHQALRVNPLKAEPEDFARTGPFSLTPVPWAKTGFYYDGAQQPGKHPLHEAGVYYIQEPSAMAPAQFLQARPGERVLDLCAAPGGKSTQIAAQMKGGGLLVCNEIHPARAKILSENIERMGIRNAVVTNETPERLAERFSGFFDRILVDAPCSGEGMFRKNEEACGEWSLENVEMCAERQDTILDSAQQMLRSGGLLVYSTCTFAPQENEGSINRFLDRFPDFTLVNVDMPEGFEAGRPDWVPGGREELARTMRLWPHKIRGEGHFLAVLKKEGSVSETEWMPVRRDGIKGLSVKEYADYLEFEKQYLTIRQEGIFIAFGDQLYLAPQGMPPLKGLKVLRPGLHLGTRKKNRFEPSHALALALKPEEVRFSCDLPSDSREIYGYLNGETFREDVGVYREEGGKGWHLITADGYSVGWGKLAGGIMKNHYPKGLRKNWSC